MEETGPPSRRRPAGGRAEDATEAAKALVPSPATSSQHSRRHALVAEADPAMLRLYREVLESSGFVVEAADSGIAAVVAAREGRPDLILVALQLRDVSGREAIG